MDKVFVIPNSIKDHAVFQAQYVEGMSQEALAQLLTQMVDLELSKSEDDLNMDLIEQCSLLLVQTLPKELQLSDQELEDKLARLKAESTHAVGHGSTKPRVAVWKRFVAAAAILVVASFMALSVVAVRQGYGNAFEYVAHSFSLLFGMDPGIYADGDLISVTRNGETVKYSSIDEMIQSEKLEVLYPSHLSSTVYIKSVGIMTDVTNAEKIYFMYNNDAYSFVIREDFTDISKIPNVTVYISNDKEFYIMRIGEQYQAICQYNKREYIITTPCEEDLHIIIDELKEYVKT